MNNRNARASKGGTTQEDPRVDGLLRAMEALGNIVGQQVRNQEATTAAAAAAAAAPPEDPLAGNGNGGQLIHKMVKQFLDLKPPKFSGDGDIEAATSWIEELEKVFDLLRCSEEDKVTLAVYQLQGNANTWWRASRDRIFPEGTVLIWDTFVETFNGKYFSNTAKEQKMAEFLRLCQNQLSMDQYEAKFAELSKYAPRMVENPEDKARRFRDGLKPEIRSVLVPFNLKDYNDLYERAQMVERDQSERAIASGSRFVHANRNNRRFGKGPVFGGRSIIPPNRKNAVGKPAPGNGGVCRFCNRRHGTAPCPFKNGACFGCGQLGHQVRDCPQRRGGAPVPLQQGGQMRGNAPQNNQNRPPAQGRVYAVTREEAKDSPTVTGTVFLHDHIAYVLFDPGATHSFVAEQFVKLVGLNPEPLGTIFKIFTPLKDSVVSMVGCPDCKLVTCGHVERIDLIMLEMYDFDVIIDMDWLTKQ